MIYNDFQGIKLSALGWGTMRLPLRPDKTADTDEAVRLTDMAMEGGINYFDTAWPYHGGESERIIGAALSRYPRESFYLADKFPGHMISESYDPQAVFEEQLEKCKVSYFDFYLLHNVCETSLHVYTDRRWDIIGYLLEQKKKGRIRHLGFSSHGRPDNLRSFLKIYGEYMEFCQIQLNYVDWTLQNAAEKCRILSGLGIPIWVMEPLHGGRLANLPEAAAEKVQKICHGRSQASAAFRWLQSVPGVTVILSGMSSAGQMEDNLSIFSKREPLNAQEKALLEETAELLKNSVPCTGCRYCCGGCPRKLDIPGLIAAFNDFSFEASLTSRMYIDQLPEDKRPQNCIDCGRCSAVCPQKIAIPSVLKKFTEKLSTMPEWEAICRQREADQKANRARHITA